MNSMMFGSCASNVRDGEKRLIDLRSDTVTLPDAAMLEAMTTAALGDDVYREDPTVRHLEEECASITGKEKALFVPSGTMGNQLALLSLAERGSEIIADELSHVYYDECGGHALWGGMCMRHVTGLSAEGGECVLREALRTENLHYAPTRVVSVENTFCRAGGTVVPVETMAKIYALASERGIRVHLDGARIFNAVTATGVDLKEYTKNCDTVMFCLSKGLGAPAGSILAGSGALIERARKYRKAMGGGMRQVGVLAAAGLIALNNRDRLIIDHKNAKLLANGISGLPGLCIDAGLVQTNMVVFRLQNGELAERFVTEMECRGVRCQHRGNGVIRMATHLNISTEDIAAAIEITRETAMQLEAEPV